MKGIQAEPSAHVDMRHRRKGSVTLCDAEVSTAIIPRTLIGKGGMLGAVELRHRDCHVEMRVKGKYGACVASGGWRRGIGHIMPS